MKLNATTASGGSLYAVVARGTASLVGLDGLTIRGSITVRLNNTGQAIDQSIDLPEDPLATQPTDHDGVDNNGNGLIDEAGEKASIRVHFGSAARIEEFSAGFDEQGDITDDSAVVISAADIFTISGAVSFTRLPSGRVDVDLPEATVAISIPVNGSLQQAFSITGAARFFFGGGQGFQLEDLRVSGFSIFGVGATIASPASALRAPTAELAQPFAASIVDVDDVQYVYVVYNDPNRAGLNDASILDAAGEFTVSVRDSSDNPLASTAITVDNAHVQKVTDAANDRTFRYPVTFDRGVLTPTILANGVTVTVTFVANQWSDQRGANAAGGMQRFTLFDGGSAPAPRPYASLASPANGATVSLDSLNAKRYIDVTFFNPSGAPIDAASAASIDGDELTFGGAGAGNVVVDKVSRLTTTGNTFRYALKERGDGALFAAGDVTIRFTNNWHIGATAGLPSTESFTDDNHPTFHGRALAVIRPTGPGEIRAIVTDDTGLRTEVTVTAEKSRACASNHSRSRAWFAALVTVR